MKMKRGMKWGLTAAMAGTLALSLAACGGAGSGGDGQTAGKGGKLTYWMRLPANIATEVVNYAETPFAKELMKRTGVEVTYIHPAQGQETEALNLLLASGSLPDIIETDWSLKGPESLMDNGTILKLNDIVENQAVNLKKYLTEHPDVDREVKTDNGNYYSFPMVRDGEKLLNVGGFMIRDDWMQELGLDYPETIEEWENVLIAFRDQKGAKAPLMGDAYTFGFLAGGFGIGEGFYVDHGKVTHGALQPGFKDYISTLNRWYNEGLLDKNFATMETSYRTACVVNGDSGVVMASGGSGMGGYISAARANGDNTYTLRAIKFPAQHKGETPIWTNKEFRFTPLGGAAITNACKDVDTAVSFLDWSYSDEGSMLNNFGIEGESYTMVDGEPVYTDKILHDPDGKPISQTLTMYVRSSAEGPFIQDERYIQQYYALPEQKEALDIWGISEAENWKLPLITRDAQETEEYSSIMADLSTFYEENYNAFIVGVRPLSELDSFVQECKDRGIERAIEINQAAYERYQNR